MIYFLNHFFVFVFVFLVRYKFLFIFIAFFIALVTGLNSGIEDFVPYSEIHDNVPVLSEWLYSSNPFDGMYGEYGYLLLNTIIKSVFDDYFFLRVTVLVIIYSVTFYVIRKTSFFIPLSIVYFMGNYFYIDSMALRNALAMAFMLMSFYHYGLANYKRAILFMFVATQFHMIAYMGFLVLLICKLIAFKKRTFIIVLLLSIFVGYLGAATIVASVLDTIAPGSAISEKLQWYTLATSGYKGGIIRGTTILHFIIIGYFIHNINKFLVFKYFRILFLSYFLSFVFLLIFNDIGLLGDRLFYTYSVTLSILVSYIPKLSKKEDRTFVLVLLMTIFYILFLREWSYFDEYIFM